MNRLFVLSFVALTISACSYDTTNDSICGAGIGSDALGTADCECSEKNVNFCDTLSRRRLDHGTWRCNTSGAINRCEAQCDNGYHVSSDKKECKQDGGNDVLECGGVECKITQNAIKMKCDGDACVVDVCETGYHLSESNLSRDQCIADGGDDVLKCNDKVCQLAENAKKMACAGEGSEAVCVIGRCNDGFKAQIKGGIIVGCVPEYNECQTVDDCPLVHHFTSYTCVMHRCVGDGCIENWEPVYDEDDDDYQNYAVDCVAACKYGHINPNSQSTEDMCINCTHNEMDALCGGTPDGVSWDKDNCRCVDVSVEEEEGLRHCDEPEDCADKFGFNSPECISNVCVTSHCPDTCMPIYEEGIPGIEGYAVACKQMCGYGMWNSSYTSERDMCIQCSEYDMLLKCGSESNPNNWDIDYCWCGD